MANTRRIAPCGFSPFLSQPPPTSLHKSIAHSEGTLRPVLALALPVVVMNFLHIAVEFTDTWLVGNYISPNTVPLAAINQITYLMWMIFTLFSVLSIGATALIARFVGGGDYKSAKDATGQALLLGLVLSILAFGVGWFILEPLVGLLKLEPDAAALAVRYLRIVLPVLPAMMVEEVGSACLRAAGDTMSGMIAVGVVNVVNIVLSASLLIGLGPFPEKGWEGLAIGSACARVVGATIILGLLVCGRAGLKLRMPQLKLNGEMMRRLLRIGTPGGADAIILVLCQLWFVAIINNLGNVAAAAHGIGVRVEALAYMPGAAFQMAAATLAGQFLGAGKPKQAMRSITMACGVATLIMTVCGFMFFFFAPELAGVFLPSADTTLTDVTARLLRVSSFSMPPLALVIVLIGALRGAGDTRWPLATTLIGFLAIRIPLSYYLAYESITLTWVDVTISGWDMGVLGAWVAMVIDIYLRCGLMLARFLHGGWKKVRV